MTENLRKIILNAAIVFGVIAVVISASVIVLSYKEHGPLAGAVITLISGLITLTVLFWVKRASRKS